MAEAVVSIVLEGLSNPIIHELKSLKSVGGKVSECTNPATNHARLLEDANASQGRNEAIRIWVASVRDAAYDLEDVIGTYVLKVAFKRKQMF
ncbi:hypothetical protein Prudu_006285 [Prunus dulcis]|uniref:Disease resistance N-terminal domain-containing protein n=1 Tax=Prunus dulcis TaxID=3755 RepID=A0A4Y1QZH8_PRUDU|nr:hypothetical protein Prudu_006285 [Prunus dulcis]